MTWTTVNFPFLSIEAQRRVRAYVSHRSGGVSDAPFDSFNLATHVGDDKSRVMTNRAILRDELALPSEPFWLNQTHSTQVVELPYEYHAELPADASFTARLNTLCTVMTADCLPILIVDDEATHVGAIHAGWRGLADGIIEQTIDRFNVPRNKLHAYLGPAIGPKSFEVGEDVHDAFLAKSCSHQAAFKGIGDGKYLADLYLLARQTLAELGIKKLSGGDHCTFTDADMFYSYRRDGQTGRMASLIWLTDET